MSDLFKLVMCHLIGDYVLQGDYLAKSKGKNWYDLWVHCMLYIIPFVIVFGYSWRIIILFLSHFIIDALKARYNKINYYQDQLLHYFIFIIYLF